jgi:hypothetical protein
LLSGFGQLDVQRAAKQLTSLSIALSCTAAEAQWQTDAHMLAALAQFSELRHLDVGNCLFVPADGAHSPVMMLWDTSSCLAWVLSFDMVTPYCCDMGAHVCSCM